MPTPHVLPSALLTEPFTVARARALGLSPEVLRGQRFWSPFRGVHVSTGVADSLHCRCRALAVAQPDVTFSHLTAARLWQLPVPGRSGRLGMPDDEPLEVTSADVRLRSRGVWGHRGALGPDEIQVRQGLRLTSGGRTWADLAGRLGVDDLVVLGDALLSRGLATLLGLTAQAAQPRRRGARQMRAVIELLEPRTDSPRETLLRLLLVRAGLPRPVANRDIVEDGEWLARPDLSYPHLRIAIEYDGEHHQSDRRQWRADITRRRLLEDAGWLLIVVTAEDLKLHPEAIVERVRRAIASRTR
jgi:hypothetical protein